MGWLDAVIAGWPRAAQHPYPRALIDRPTWRQAIDRLAVGAATMLGLWGENEVVHLALAEEGLVGVLSLACAQRRFPSVARLHPPALRLERAVRDLYGLEAEGAVDRRRWLDHGRWGLREPLGARQRAVARSDGYTFLAAEGTGIHQHAVGPVHAGIIEPGHFRFAVNGETIVRLEQRLGYTHKGIDQLMIGASVERAAKLAGRVSGDSTVAYAIAFARAVEAAMGIEPPPRATLLRALMGELERLANHFGDIGAIGNDAAFSLLHAHCAILREEVLRASEACFGHRLMMDRVVPGGTSADLTDDGAARIRRLIAGIRRRFPELVALYDNTASLQDRTVNTGILTAELAAHYGAGGFIGRASGRAIDARKTPGYPPYTRLQFEVPVRQQGDVDARVWVRIEEVGQSLELIAQILDSAAPGPTRIALGEATPGQAMEGLALVEGFRGDILAWVRIGGNGTVARCHLRDPSWFQWPLLEAAIEGNIVADFPLCNKSFNCSYSGHDL